MMHSPVRVLHCIYPTLRQMFYGTDIWLIYTLDILGPVEHQGLTDLFATFIVNSVLDPRQKITVNSRS